MPRIAGTAPAMLLRWLRSRIEYRACVRHEVDRLVATFGGQSLDVARERAYRLIDAPANSDHARLAWDILHHLEARRPG